MTLDGRPAKFFLASFLVVAAAVFSLYGRSVPYPFVYDDLWRIVRNDSIRTLDHPGRFFSDPRTQSSNAELQRDNYRPIEMLSLAVDHSLFGMKPAWYRIENLLWHTLNGALVSLLAVELFALSTGAALLSGLLFAVHPVQVESVVWVVERTNVLGQFFLLLSLLFWVRFQRGARLAYAAGTHVCLGLSLLTREAAVVVPLALLAIDALNNQRKRWLHYGISAAIVGIFLAVRWSLIGQMSIAELKGGDWSANLSNVAQIWPLYWRLLFFPTHLRVTYSDIQLSTGVSSGPVLLGIFALTAYAIGLALAWRRAPRLALALVMVGIFWLPGSNLIPLTTLFAERLLYPVVAGFAWAGGLLYDRLASQELRRVYATGVLILLSFVTWIQIPVWQSERALWKNATQQAPTAWFAWACYGQDLQRGGLYEESESALETALKNGPAKASAGSILYLLAKTRLRLGKFPEAESAAATAIRLQPELATPWKNLKAS